MSTKYELKNLNTGKTSLLDAISGTIGPDVLNISNLTKDQGVFTFDPGFMATASTESKITYIDGDAGVLLYRGYPVEQLAEKSSFLEVATLLISGTLPTAAELDAFKIRSCATPWSTNNCCGFSRASITTRIRWPWCPRWSHRWPRSITTPRTSAILASRDLRAPDHCEAADHCRRGVQTYAGAAVHLSAQRSALLREHAQHVLRGSVRAVRHRSGGRRGIGPAVHIACGP